MEIYGFSMVHDLIASHNQSMCLCTVARSEQIKVESKTYVATKEAEAQREIAENQAKCMELSASAEMEAAKQLTAQRKYNKMMRSLQSMRALAVNKDVCVAGNNGDNVVAQLVANVKSGAILGLPSNMSS